MRALSGDTTFSPFQLRFKYFRCHEGADVNVNSTTELRAIDTKTIRNNNIKCI